MTPYPGRQAQTNLLKNINYINLYYTALYFPITIRMVLTHLYCDESEGALVDWNAPAINMQSVTKAIKLVNVYLPLLSVLQLITAFYSKKGQ
jgi:hypothetical protein